MTITNKIALLSFGALLIFDGIDPVQAQWTGSPVLIGGDDTDDHFEMASQPAGRPYIREGFNFLGGHVTNGKTIAVCIGCNI